jgi:dethiobiotin synthetase
MILEADKIGSATSPLKLTKTVSVISENNTPKVGDVVVVRALGESVIYGNLELPSGRLARINAGDVLLGVLGKRRALKGFVGDVPDAIKTGDKLHLLNMGGVIGICKGHHSSLSDAIQVEVLGIACDENETILNIADNALKPTNFLEKSAPVVVVAGTCMNSGKTVAVTEIIKQAHHAGLRVAGGKLSGVAALRDTLNMQDSGATATASFLDCGLPSTVDAGNLAPMAKAILNKLNESEPDLIIVELGDGIVGGYAVDSILQDSDIKQATAAFVFCASDYVGVIGGIEVLRRLGIEIDVIAGSVTDSQMGEDFVQKEFGINAENARRDGLRLFTLISNRMDRINRIFASNFYPECPVHPVKF